MNDRSYTEIQDTLRINKKLFYKFYSLVNGDATNTVYLRIDEQNKLIESCLDSPSKTCLHAKIGDKFFKTGRKDDNDNEVAIFQKSDTEMTFSFYPVYHSNLKGHPSQVKYIKGKGWIENYKKLKINGIVYQN